MRFRAAATLLLLALPTATAAAQGAGRAAADIPEAVRMVINADLGRDTISRHIYGQFAEHLGRGIYDGVWTRSGTGEWRVREDVFNALKAIRVPNIRWPGGCFADYYHWRDGIGPREQRPTIVNTMWGGVTEDNGVGTHEFLDFTERLGAEAFVVGNVGSGTVQEMAEWWEYINFPGTSPRADLRRKNGRERPWNVRFWGVGNESWGCGGNMTPEYYANEFKRYATYLAPYGRVRPFRIATGPSDQDYRWMEVMMREAGGMMEAIDLHYYTLVGSWTTSKGSSTQFGEREWFTGLSRALRMEEFVTRHAAIMDRYDPQKRVALLVGEWGMWHDPEPGTNPGFLYQQNTIRDALVASATLDILNRHADRVRMANIAQMVNVLQAMILTKGDQMILTPTYHVYDFYTVHHDALLLPSAVEGGRYEFEGQSIPAVSASASRDRAGRMHVTMSNLDPNRARTVPVEVRGARVSRVTGRILTAGAMNAHNSFERPQAVQPAPFSGARVTAQGLTVELPPKSVVVLEVQ